MDDDDDLDFEEAHCLKRAVPLSSTAVQHSFGRGRGCIEKLLPQLVPATHSVLRCGGGGARDGDSGDAARCGKMRGLTTGSKPKISGRARVLMRGHVEERKPGSCRTIRVRTWAVACHALLRSVPYDEMILPLIALNNIP